MRRQVLGLVVVVAVALLAGSSLARPGYYDSHDGLLNLHRLVELEACFADAQIPCRWVPHMGAGYGYPLFNFYPPLPTHIAAGLRALGAGFLVAVKGALWLALLVSALGMYGLARSFFGTNGGIAAAVVYTLAPYQALDIFVRGAFAETWALAWIPLVFWTGERTLRGGGLWPLACALAWAALLLTHDITALMIAVPYAAWLLWWLRDVRPPHRTRALRDVLLGHGFAVALAAWFVAPALLELGHIHAETLTSLQPWARFENNYLRFTELFALGSSWSYGPFRSADGMSLFVGPVQLMAAAAAAGVLGIRARRAEVGPAGSATAWLLASGVAALAMTLAASRPVWDALPPLAFLQFPWRFLSLATFGFSFAAGYAVQALGKQGRAADIAAGVLCACAIATSWSWFQPRAMHDVRDEVLANPREVARSRHGLFDFLPAGVDLDAFLANPPRVLPPPAEPAAGIAVQDASRSSRRISLDVRVEGPATRLLTLNSYDFPGWRLEVDGKPVPISGSPDRLGRLRVDLPPGDHRVTAHFGNTPARSIANATSLLAASGMLVWLVLLMRRSRTAD